MAEIDQPCLCNAVASTSSFPSEHVSGPLLEVLASTPEPQKGATLCGGWSVHREVRVGNFNEQV
jgi:hypothetical protein